MQVELTRMSQLAPVHWNTWSELQATSQRFESPYFRPEYALAVSRARDDVEVAVLSRGERPIGYFPFQRDRCGMGRPVGGKLSDFHGVVAAPGAEIDLPALVRKCRLASWDFDHLVLPEGSRPACVRSTESSPWIDLSQGWPEYCARRKAAGSEAIVKAASRERKLTRELGAPTFEFDANHDKPAFDALIAWKSAQLIATGFADVFQFDWTRRLLAELPLVASQAFTPWFSVLRVGERAIASAYWLRAGKVGHLWLIGYDPAVGAYSPGMVMFMHLLEDAAAQGIERVHLGTGDQRYKRSLATDAVDLGVGAVETFHPLVGLRRAWRACRDRVGALAETSVGRLVTKGLAPWRSWWAYR